MKTDVEWRKTIIKQNVTERALIKLVYRELTFMAHSLRIFQRGGVLRIILWKSKQTERFSDNQTDDHNAYPRLVCPDLWTGWWCNAIRIKRLTLCGINWNEIKHDLLQGCVNGTAIDCATGWNKPPSHEQSRAESAADLLSGLVLPHWDNPIVPIVPVRRWILGSVKLSV